MENDINLGNDIKRINCPVNGMNIENDNKDTKC